MVKIKRALISVSDKNGIVDFGKHLRSLGVEIISTGGTARLLRSHDINCIEIADYTGFPEMLDGRVKTLHPKIHGGLLSVRQSPDHMRQIKDQGIGLIDMVVVNLYPFGKVTSNPKVGLAEAIENIDIGGPSMLRSAAKNYESVAVVTNPETYSDIAKELSQNDGCLSLERLKSLAVAVFELTTKYDQAIAQFLGKRLTPEREKESTLPDLLLPSYIKVRDLRYGENPHQKAALYRQMRDKTSSSLVGARQLQGKELSFNNYLDLQAAFELIAAFQDPAACVIKHGNPTGVACDKRITKALKLAWQTDSLSAFGGIVGLNQVVDESLAKVILSCGFLECIVAPKFEKKAVALLKDKKNLRLLELSLPKEEDCPLDFKKINGGLLLQDADYQDYIKKDLKVVTKIKPTASQMTALLFSWKVVKFVKSNAIVLASGRKTVGIGMGQTSRVDSVFMAVKRAGSRARSAVLASDAFFPHPDNISVAKKAGIKAIIQPGGSIADEKVIAAADKAGISMVFTGIRHFKH